MKNAHNRLLINVDHGNDELKFYSATGLLLAVGYTRVVIGERGPYVEFKEKHIQWGHFFIPAGESYRQTNDIVFYLEYRSFDRANVKLYLQKRTVSYADYKIGLCYIAPADLLREEMQPVIIAP